MMSTDGVAVGNGLLEESSGLWGSLNEIPLLIGIKCPGWPGPLKAARQGGKLQTAAQAMMPDQRRAEPR